MPYELPSLYYQPHIIKMESSEPWVAMPIIKSIVLGAIQLGANASELFSKADIDYTLIDQSETLLTFEQNCRIMEAVLTCTPDPFVGLHIGEQISPMVLGMVGYLMETSPTLNVGLLNLTKFTNTFTQIYTYNAEVIEDQFLYYFEPIPKWNLQSPLTAHQSVDISMSGLMNIIKLMTGKKIFPLKVDLRYNPPTNMSEYIRIYRVQPRFNQNRNCIIFSLSDLDSPLKGYNDNLNKLFIDLLNKELVKLSNTQLYSQRIRHTVIQQSQLGNLSLKAIAKQLHSTPRTIQRRLAEENVSFKEIIESVKKDIAIQLVQSPQLTVSEIAYKLGYADVASFSRAFSKWTGSAPSLFRKT